MFLPSKSTIYVKYGEDQAPFISVHGDGFHASTLKTASLKSPSLVQQDTLLDLEPLQSFPVATECSCVRSVTSNLSARKTSNSHETSFSHRFSRNSSLDDPDESQSDDDREGEEALHLNKLLSTLHKFSSRILNPLQARSIARLAKSYKGRERITKEHASMIQGFLDCESPPIQDAALISLSKLAVRKENVEILFSRCSELLDDILSLASDPSTIEVQVSALSVIEQITMDAEHIKNWEEQLEDIVYPLIHAIIKNRESAEVQKLSSLNVMRNLSQIPQFAAKVKQDILSQLSSAQDSSKIKARHLEILQENLQLCKQKISSDVLDNTLLPVLTDMLVQGPCQAQCQSLKLLSCLHGDDTSRSSLLYNPQTVALSILCARHSHCRKVLANSCQLIQGLLLSKSVAEARKFMECVSESVQLVEGESPEPANLSSRDDRVNSPVRRKSRAEAQLWRHFDDFLAHMILLLESQGCIYHENAHSVKCELSLIGSINADQLSCISSLISCFNHLCSWPLRRPRKSSGSIGEVDDFLSAVALGFEIKRLSHHHTVNVWARVGASVMALLRQVMKRIPSPEILARGSDKTPRRMNSMEVDEDSDSETSQSQPVTNFDSVGESKKSEDPTISVESILYPEETNLLKELVKFVLVMSVASCYFKKSSHVEGKHNSSQSVNENVEKRVKEELAEKEMCSERRILRRSLVEEGVFYLMAQLVRVEESDLKTMSSTVLRLCLQPVNEKAQAATARKSAQSNLFASQKVRPQSAKAAYDIYARDSINQTLFQMSKPGVGQRPQSSVPYCTTRSNPAINPPRNGSASLSRQRPATAKTVSFSREISNASTSGIAKYSMFSPLTPRADKKPIFLRSGGEAPTTERPDIRPASRLSSIVTQKANSKNLDGQPGSLPSRPTSATSKLLKKDSWLDSSTVAVLVAPLDPGNNLSQQCCERALLAAGDTTLKGIFSSDIQVKKSNLLLLHDLVLYSKNDVHMELSRKGCIPKLVDFLRINDDNELLEITGLTVTRMLVSSDRRICQLFNIHGGSNMLMALLHKHPTQELRQAVSSTLNTVNFVMHTAPTSSMTTAQSSRPADIWEHIMRRWEGEDKVVAVLKQFL